MITKTKVIRLFADSNSPYYGRSHAEQDYLFADLDSIGEAFAKEPSSWGADGLIFSNDFDDLTWKITQDDTHIVLNYSYLKEGDEDKTEGIFVYRYSQFTLFTSKERGESK